MILYSTDADFRLHSAEALFRDGLKRDDLLRQVYGASLTGTNFLMLENNQDSCLHYLNLCLNLSQRLDSLVRDRHSWIVALAYNNLGLFFINNSIDYPKASEYFFQAFEYLDEEDCPDLYAILLANLVVVHYFIEDSSGLEYAELCYDYMMRHKTPFAEFVANYSMALMLYVSGDFEASESYARRALELTEKPEVGSVKYKVATNTILARSLIALEKDAEAIAALERAVDSATDYEPELIETYLVYGDYWYDRGDYAKAVSVYRKAMEVSFQDSLLVYLDQVYKRASEVSELMGDYRQALAYFRQYHLISDSTFNAQRDYALTELKVRYKLEHYANQIQERQLEVLHADKQRQLWLFLFVLSTFAGGAVWVLYRRKNRYYERIVRQYRENMNLNRQIRNIESREGDAEKYNYSSLTKSRADELFGQAERMMREECVYRDSELTVDKLAALLKTNRTYLSQVINEKAGMNFSRYVNRYRMNEALERLSDPSDHSLLKSLALDLGFRSATAFSKVFADETGISPSAYRKKSLEIDKLEREE